MNDLAEQLKRLAEMQANTQRQLDTLLARDPKKEFTAREGNVGSDPRRLAFEKVESSFQILTSTIMAAKSAVFSSNLDVYGFEILWSWLQSTTSEGGTYLPRALAIEVDKLPTFPQPVFILIPSTSSLQLNQIDPTTGDVSTYPYHQYYKFFPLKYRWVRIAGTYIWASNNWSLSNTTGNGSSGVQVTFYGQ